MHSKYWMPLVWAGAILKKARKERRICNDAMLLAMVNEINRIRSVSGDLLNYDWVNIPLVYTQVTRTLVWSWNSAKNFPSKVINGMMAWQVCSYKISPILKHLIQILARKSSKSPQKIAKIAIWQNFTKVINGNL